MKEYRNLDQDYIDEYDSYTIELLKKLEAESPKPIYRNTTFKNSGFRYENDLDFTTPFYQEGVRRAKSKDDSIRKSMREDEQKDRMVKEHPIPDIIRCNVCNTRMWFKDYWFRNDNKLMLFVFTCPKKHTPNKILYPNGEEYFHPERKCDRCGSEIVSTSKKKKGVLTCTDTCIGCGKVTIDEYDLVIEPKQPITEEDRKKYCTDFIGRNTFLDDLKAIVDLIEDLKVVENEEKEKKELELDKIEKPTIPQLEQRLIKMTEKIGFIKFQFDKPEIGRFVTVGFSVQDPTDRDEYESIKVLVKAFKPELFLTNWRLVSPRISYRLGFLSGQVKAYDGDDGLKKIAKEILADKNKQSNSK